MAVVIAIDAGTTGVRAFALDEAGTPAGWSYREFPQHFPRPGLGGTRRRRHLVGLATLAELCGRPGGAGQTVAAVGITNQRETMVAWSRRTGRPLARAIVWQDRRTADALRGPRRGRPPPARAARDRPRARPLLQRHQGGVAARPRAASRRTTTWPSAPIDAWVLWNLTGGTAAAGAQHATEPSNASRTLLFDVRTLAWSAELAELFGVPLGALPEVRRSSGELGRTAPGATALAGGMPISGIAGDQQAALFGQACFDAGMTKNTYGTGSFVLMNVGPTWPEPVEGLLTSVGWTLADGTRPTCSRAPSSSPAPPCSGCATAWASSPSPPRWGRWPRRCPTPAASASCPPSPGWAARGGIPTPGARSWASPGGRPGPTWPGRWWSRWRSRPATCSRPWRAASGRSVPELRVDGGASVMAAAAAAAGRPDSAYRWRGPRVTETTALGAAYLAGLGAGVWDGLAEVATRWALDVGWSPRPIRPRPTPPTACGSERSSAPADWAR